MILVWARLWLQYITVLHDVIHTVPTHWTNLPRSCPGSNAISSHTSLYLQTILLVHIQKPCSAAADVIQQVLFIGIEAPPLSIQVRITRFQRDGIDSVHSTIAVSQTQAQLALRFQHTSSSAYPKSTPELNVFIAPWWQSNGAVVISSQGPIHITCKLTRSCWIKASAIELDDLLLASARNNITISAVGRHGHGLCSFPLRIELLAREVEWLYGAVSTVLPECPSQISEMSKQWASTPCLLQKKCGAWLRSLFASKFFMVG